MSIAWATIIVVALLLPGFAFLGGLYFPDRVTRESTPISPLGQLAIVVALSLGVHGFLYASINLLLDCASGQWGFSCVAIERFIPFLRIDGALSNSISLIEMRRVLDEHVVRITAYFLGSALVGFAPGLAVGTAISHGFLQNTMPHRWMNMLIEARRHDGRRWRSRRSLVRVRTTVLSKTSADGSVVIYEGIISDFFAKADGTINLMVLRSAKRGILRVSGKRVAEPALYTQLESDATIGDKFLVLTSSDVANVYFEKQVIEVTTDDKDHLAALISSRTGPVSSVGSAGEPHKI